MKILIIEDDPKILEIMRDCCRREKFTVESAQDGLSGFNKAKERHYDVIILDVMLPKKSGFEIISGLRALEIHTPILVVSARSMVEDRVLGLDLGADDYLIKNFSSEEFLARIKSLFRRGRLSQSIHQRGNNILRQGDLVVNLSTMQVHRENRPIQLSRKEMGILIELMRRKNKVISREQLIQAIWGERDAEVLSNTIDAHIKTLRAKIDRPFRSNMIKTVRGFGYMIEG